MCIETTRPELLAACVALIAHPDDERYKPLFGTTVASPVYGVEVPILPHPEAEMDKGGSPPTQEPEGDKNALALAKARLELLKNM